MRLFKFVSKAAPDSDSPLARIFVSAKHEMTVEAIRVCSLQDLGSFANILKTREKTYVGQLGRDNDALPDWQRYPGDKVQHRA